MKNLQGFKGQKPITIFTHF